MALTRKSRERTKADSSSISIPDGLPAFLNDGHRPVAGGIRAEFVENLGPVSTEDIPELRRRYASLIIQLDRLRPAIEAVDMFMRPKDEVWSIKETLGHLIDTDRDIWWPRIERLLTEESPQFEDVDHREITLAHNWQLRPIEDILSQLVRARWNYALKLDTFAPSDFCRSGEHALLGEICILRIVQILVAHDEYYLKKIQAMIGSVASAPAGTGRPE